MQNLQNTHRNRRNLNLYFKFKKNSNFRPLPVDFDTTRCTFKFMRDLVDVCEIDLDRCL